MSLVSTLLQAIVSVDGEALVMHPGARPYVVAPSGQVELSSAGLTFEAVGGIVAQLLPVEFQRSLEQFGAVQYELPPQTEFPRDQFTLIAARGGDDIWAEVRRRRLADDDHGAHALFATAPSAFPEAPAEIAPAVSVAAAASLDKDFGTLALGRVVQTAPAGGPPQPIRPARSQAVTPETAAPVTVHPAPALVFPQPRPQPRPESLSRRHVDESGELLGQLLRTAAARHASVLYLSSGRHPVVRVDGTLHALDAEPVLTSSGVTSILSVLAADVPHGAHVDRTIDFWCEIGDAHARVRCTTFSDRHGPGVMLRFAPAIGSIDELGLSGEVKALASEIEGLVVVAGPRGSGKRTLIDALLGIVNETRRAHVVTVEREAAALHPSGRALISQREVLGSETQLLDAARAALREDPDILVVQEVRTTASIEFVLEAAASGRLVIAGLSTPNTTSAIERLVEGQVGESSRTMRLTLARHLRAVVAQLLLPKIGGGTIAAREVLLNSPAVATLIAEGRLAELPSAIATGKRQGMVPLAESVLRHVQNHLVDVRHACDRVDHVPGLLAVLDRHGIDTSSIQRPA